MERIPASVSSSFWEIMTYLDLLNDSIKSVDLANIIRSCSHISYCAGDILKQVIPDGVSVKIEITNLQK